jgi:3-hydroxyisobutyrate dehydrogenase
MNKLRVGVIGLGAMGLPMAQNLAAKGFLTGVHNRTLARAKAFAEASSVKAYQDIAALAADVDVILSCVSADDDLRAVVDQARAGLKPQTVWIDTSTVSPSTAQALCAELKQLDIALLDAPVSGGVEGAKSGSLSIMVGGDNDAMTRTQEVLEAIGKRITWMGPSGSGQATKAINQVMVAGIAAAVAEGLALAEQLGLPTERLVEVIMNGAASNWFLGKRAPTMLQSEFNLGFKSELMLKDLRICATLHPGDLPLVERAIAQFAQLVADGHGSDDISAMIRLSRQRLALSSDANVKGPL